MTRDTPSDDPGETQSDRAVHVGIGLLEDPSKAQNVERPVEGFDDEVH